MAQTSRFGSPLCGALALALQSCSPAGDPAPGIAVGKGWARETARGQAAAAVYLTITNKGDGADRLVDVEARKSSGARLHATSNEGGIARMRPVENGLDIGRRSIVELKPGGTHIMLTGLEQRLSPGETTELTLGFARSGKRPVTIRIVAAGGESGHGVIM